MLVAMTLFLPLIIAVVVGIALGNVLTSKPGEVATACHDDSAFVRLKDTR